MATRKRQSSKGGNGWKSRAGRADTAAAKDAIALLKANHREVERYFADFEESRSEDPGSHRVTTGQPETPS